MGGMTSTRTCSAGPPPTLLPDDPGPRRAARERRPGRRGRRRPTRSPRSPGRPSPTRRTRAAPIVESYAYARVGYHRGLDRLRRSGWKGHGPVPVGARAQPRLPALARTRSAGPPATIGETAEADRCATFLRDSTPRRPGPGRRGTVAFPRRPTDRKGTAVPAIVLVGAQWGDEGKGKATDLLGASRRLRREVQRRQQRRAHRRRRRREVRPAPAAVRHPHARRRPGHRQRRRRRPRGAVRRDRRARRRAASTPRGLVVSANAHVIPSYNRTRRQGHRAVPRQPPDRHDRSRHRADVRRQDEPRRHPRPGPLRREDPARRRSTAPSSRRTSCS